MNPSFIPNSSQATILKRYVALARVSSREQEREGFSLAVQEDALRNYATREGGEIIKLFRIRIMDKGRGVVLHGPGLDSIPSLAISP